MCALVTGVQTCALPICCATIAAALARMPTRRFAMARFERGARQPRGHRRPDAFDIPAHAACLKRGGRRRNGPFVRAAKRDRAKVMSTETLIEPPLQDADALIADMGARARAAAKIMATAPTERQSRGGGKSGMVRVGHE